MLGEGWLAGWKGMQVMMAVAQVLMGWPALPPLASWMQLRTHISWEGWTTRGGRVFRLGKMKDASGNSSLGSRWGSVACLGACPGRPTRPFLPRADGDKLAEVMDRLLGGAFPEPELGSPASGSDLPSPGPCSVRSPEPDGLFQIGSTLLLAWACAV